ncbi:MAG TPA: DUF885 domain-containing protein [Opitutaceae bacterium]|nr:DUF885 domain-containing protein [Opitutaceae bacterium]HND60682.1 DUF885 domain-containing protein [Opitutaceae bacterium]
MRPRILTLAALFALAASRLLAGTTADAAFERIAHDFIESYLRQNPENATEIGDHRYDGQLTDYSAAGRDAAAATLRGTLAALATVDAAQLTGPNRVDAQILRQHVEYELFTLEQLRPFANNPRLYQSSFADSIYELSARGQAPADVRLRAIAQRLAAMPRVIAEAKANLEHPARVHTETAIDQTAGAIQLIRDDLESLLQQAPTLRAEVAPVQARAVAALTEYQAWLKQDLLPRSTGDFRLGEKLFRQKLKYALGSDLSPETIMARAEQEKASVTDQLYATARLLYLQYFPQAAAADVADRPRVIKAVLDHLAERSLTDDTIVNRAKDSLARATAFVRQHELVTVPDTPVQVIVVPEFARGVAVAYCQSPGALEPKGETFFAISPTPTDWPAARKHSFYREYNEYMLQDLTVHEAMPGHYLQIAHANQFRAPTLVRALFRSGSFIEGWAVYGERVMADTGFGGPEVRMQQLKMRLRAIINAILDQRIHMGTMTEKEAIALMMKEGFQEEGEAVGKWKRAILTSTQLSTYFVGAIEHDDLRAAAEKRDGAKFNLKQYHDTVLSYGNANVKYVRQEMGL